MTLILIFLVFGFWGLLLAVGVATYIGAICGFIILVGFIIFLVFITLSINAKTTMGNFFVFSLVGLTIYLVDFALTVANIIGLYINDINITDIVSDFFYCYSPIETIWLNWVISYFSVFFFYNILYFDMKKKINGDEKRIKTKTKTIGKYFRSLYVISYWIFFTILMSIGTLFVILSIVSSNNDLNGKNIEVFMLGVLFVFPFFILICNSSISSKKISNKLKEEINVKEEDLSPYINDEGVVLIPGLNVNKSFRK